MSLPKYTLANENGIIRKEEVFSTVDVLDVDTAAGRADATKIKTVNLQVAQDVTLPSHRLVTQSLVNIDTGSYFTVPVGSIIKEFVVSNADGSDLDDDLSMVLGYLSPDISDADRKRALAGRIASIDNQLTGPLLDLHKTIKFDQKLYAAELTAQRTIYDAEDAANGVPPGDVDYSVVTGNTVVGESRALIPCITVNTGTLFAGQLSFALVYCPPAYVE